ncbi:MAG: transcriptional repressor [Firmicutes bacterium]|nr:transcriptional repressor [Bacillota bacterium]
MADIVQILHDAGLKHTPGREALLNVLMRSAHPMTQEEISRELAGSGMNRVTIYRALDSFTKAGIVHRVENGDRVWKFAFCGCGSHGHCHPHFTCRNCGKVECLPGIELPDIPKPKAGYIIEERQFYLRGLCARCS